MLTYRAFDEVIDFITSIPKPEEILTYKPSIPAQKKLTDLLQKKQNSLLNEAETHELEQYMMIEHIMRMAKKKARKQIEHE